MEKEILRLTQEVGEVKTELKYLVDGFNELKEINKLVVSLMERQNNFSDRILKLENSELKEVRDLIQSNGEKIRKLEDWKLTIITGAGVVGALVSFLVNKLF